MFAGLTTNKAFIAALTAFAGMQLAADAPGWLKLGVAGAAWLLTYIVPNKDAPEGAHEAD